MNANKKELIRAINENVRELRKNIDMHHRLITSVLEERADLPDLERVMGLYPSRSHESVLKGAIGEAIDVLEESRKAFKSKRLESLRKRLTRVLIDTK
jgi:hypothetical protein